MIWGQLGDISLKHPLVPESFRRTHAWGYAQKDRISGKASLQQVPDTLYDAKFSFSVHYLEGNLTPREYLQQFIALGDSKEAIALTVGGEVLGNFVITDIPVTFELFSEDGALLEVRWEVNLLEYANQPERKKQKVTGFFKRVRT